MPPLPRPPAWPPPSVAGRSQGGRAGQALGAGPGGLRRDALPHAGVLLNAAAAADGGARQRVRNHGAGGRGGWVGWGARAGCWGGAGDRASRQRGVPDRLKGRPGDGAHAKAVQEKVRCINCTAQPEPRPGALTPPPNAGNVKGVDSTASSHEAIDAAKAIARENRCIVAVSGATDLVGRAHQQMTC
jgi:hypothetical protein